ncbi:PQQ-dependent sugar dehydrogenase [Amaricoccus solimangrovi]|uniref:PQQ-dependent sugar dehydrogenase n=1 Tax=Amaricoccus solimangrovi TaxID=2589815 RepID=A0A501WLY0_9RHOB|nr:PQQ-dependent sugar dehydrogenase [Amaricoccus solimangrovi]TPE50793.1 PQQ-dependent sugar dehydrogenase [Amaricoccus solimangrovi]
MRLVPAGLALAILACGPGPAAAERYETSAGAVEVSRMASGLSTPWSLAFLPGNAWLVTERDGRLLLIEGGAARPVSGVPEVWARGQGGLLDVVVARDYAFSHEIFLTFAEWRGAGAATSLAVAKLDQRTAALDDVEVIFRQEPPAKGGAHFGGRVVEAPDGTLFLTLGERHERETAQYLDNDRGKIVRIRRDGAPAARNPFSGRADARAEIWSFGHRNPQGIAMGPDGALWETEHGPQGGDEVNRIAPGRNYGWPVVTFGEEYGGGAIGRGTGAPGMEAPLHVWTPSIAPSGLMVYSGELWPEWKGDLFAGSLKYDFISRLSPDGRDELERMFQGEFARIRDIREAPDGAIWFIAESDGAVWRMVPAPGS